jgi:hypothetical protein
VFSVGATPAVTAPPGGGGDSSVVPPSSRRQNRTSLEQLSRDEVPPNCKGANGRTLGEIAKLRFQGQNRRNLEVPETTKIWKGRLTRPGQRRHVWTPPLMQEESFLTSTERGRVLPCVRPLMRRFTCRGPVWDPRVRSTSLERARIALAMRLVLLTPSHRRCAIPVL